MPKVWRRTRILLPIYLSGSAAVFARLGLNDRQVSRSDAYDFDHFCFFSWYAGYAFFPLHSTNLSAGRSPW